MQLKIKEGANSPVLGYGFLAVRLEEMESVRFPFRLEQRRLPFPSTLPQPAIVRPSPVPQRVRPAYAHQRPAAAQARQARRRLGHRVDHWVVQPRRRRAHRPPQRLQVLRRRRVNLRRFHPVRSQEVRVDQRDAADRHAARQPADPRSHGHVVGYVGPRALAREEHPLEVGALRQPRLRRGPPHSSRVAGHPAEDRPRVVVGGGDRVLRSEAVVGRDGDDVGLSDEGIEVVVEQRDEGRAEAEATAVEVNEDGELLLRSIAFAEHRDVQAGRDSGFRRDEHVLGRDSGGGVDGGGRGVCAEVALDAAALEDADEAGRRIVYDLVVGIHRIAGYSQEALADGGAQEMVRT
ncbi:unnamed protein product, partial [Musa acuminata subsp. malaccensis]